MTFEKLLIVRSFAITFLLAMAQANANAAPAPGPALALALEPAPVTTSMGVRHRRKPLISQPIPVKKALPLTGNVFRDCQLKAKDTGEDLKGRLHSFMACMALNGSFTGAVLVAQDKDTLTNAEDGYLLKAGYGLAERGKNSRLVDPDTKFLLGSITKQFVAALILNLEAQKQLSFSAKVPDLLPPELLIPNSKWKSITLRDLLVHSSRIPDYAPEINNIIRNRWDSNQVLIHFEGRPLNPSATYSNTNYLVLVKILENKLGMPWKEIVESRLSGPFLKDTGVYSLDNFHSEYAVGYVPEAKKYREALYRDPKIFLGVGDLYSNVSDLFEWEHLLFSTNLIVPQDVSAKFMEEPLFREYSCGAKVTKNLERTDKPVSGVQGHMAVYRTGHLNGFANIVTYFPQEKLVTVILSNSNEYPIVPLSAFLAGMVFTDNENLISHRE